jgi:acetyl-CoA acyltransferase
MKETVIPMAIFTDEGWKVADRDEFLRPDTTMEALATLRTPFRVGGRVTAGNSAGLTDGATASLLASAEAAEELGLQARMRLVGYAFAGVEPELMGIGPIPATERVLERAGITIDDVDVFELNEPFAVQVLTWCDALGVAADDPRLNPYGGAIACGHPLAATGVRLMAQLAYGFRERGGRYGLTALCIGMGMGCAVLWENLSPSSPASPPAARSAAPAPPDAAEGTPLSGAVPRRTVPSGGAPSAAPEETERNLQ